jgi:heme exporter protein B
MLPKRGSTSAKRVLQHDRACPPCVVAPDRPGSPARRSLMRAVFETVRCVMHRDLLLAVRRRSDAATVVLFFVIVATLFPLAVGPDPGLLRTLAPGVIWVAALLASILALPRMFEQDHADGCLEPMLLSTTPLGIIVAAKIGAHWLVTGVPLVLLTPILALQFDLSQQFAGVLMGSLLLGTPVLSLIGAIGAALTLGLRGGGALLGLLVLPLYVPVLVIGAGAVGAAADGLGASAHLLLLAAFLTIAAAFAPWATAAALRISAE